MIFIQVLWDFIFSIHLHALAFIKKPLPNSKDSKNKKTIILLSGYGEPWTYMKQIKKNLLETGFSTHEIPGFARNLKTIPEQAKIVENFLDEKKFKNVTLVAHSKGGLVAKYLLQYSKQSMNIKKVVNIASPYRGVAWGHLRLMNLHELKPGSKVLKDLNNKIGCEKIINIYPRIDNVVIRKQSLKLQGCLREIELDVVGHANILFSKELTRFLEQEI